MRLIQKDDLSLVVLEPCVFGILRKYYLDNREHLAPWEPSRNDAFFTEENIKSVVTSRYEQYSDETALHLCAIDAEEMVAEVNFTNIVKGAFQCCNLGFSVATSLEGLGTMTKVVKSGIRVIFGKYCLHRIQANYMPRNHRSSRLVENCGFRVEGYAREYLKIAGKWEDHVLTSLINSAHAE
ncbi:MAG: GNAT family N-acetyltransferase [Gammaproteobacteria bacterium]|nr:GNAT family N-acetyltransferase [Gammaproteobacteria bacterium]